MKKLQVQMRIDLQCGACSALVHLTDPSPRFCACCGATFERYCLKCQKRVEMFFEEWWPTDEECVRTYSPAKRCPTCNAGLHVESKDHLRGDSHYSH